MDDRPWGRITLDHLGIATEDLDEAMRFWSLMGLWPSGEDETVRDQGVTTRFLPLDDQGPRPPTQIELLEPTGHDTPVGRFLERRGPGIQQVCFAVDDLASLLDHLHDSGIRLINRTPTTGAHGSMIAFVHPRSTGGILVELTQRDAQ